MREGRRGPGVNAAERRKGGRVVGQPPLQELGEGEEVHLEDRKLGFRDEIVCIYVGRW
jgi:hypothetical protein